jgi:hypothetical protein
MISDSFSKNILIDKLLKLMQGSHMTKRNNLKSLVEIGDVVLIMVIIGLS